MFCLSFVKLSRLSLDLLDVLVPEKVSPTSYSYHHSDCQSLITKLKNV